MHNISYAGIDLSVWPVAAGDLLGQRGRWLPRHRHHDAGARLRPSSAGMDPRLEAYGWHAMAHTESYVPYSTKTL